jgi:hypothetical protein
VHHRFENLTKPHNQDHHVHSPTRSETTDHTYANHTDGGAKPQSRLAEGASVKILSPTANQVFTSDKVPLKFQLTKGKEGDHVHAYVDGELMGMFTGKQGTLNGVKPGRHVLELRVVAQDHQTELDARDRIEFVVK